MTGFSPSFAPGEITISKSGFTATWPPSSSDAGATVIFSLTGPQGMLVCAQDDAVGALTISASDLSALWVGTHLYEAEIGRMATVVDSSTGRSVFMSVGVSFDAPCNVTP